MFIGVIDEKNFLIGTKELVPLTERSNDVYVEANTPKELFTEKGDPIYKVDMYGSLVRANSLTEEDI